MRGQGRPSKESAGALERRRFWEKRCNSSPPSEFQAESPSLPRPCPPFSYPPPSG